MLYISSVKVLWLYPAGYRFIKSTPQLEDNKGYGNVTVLGSYLQLQIDVNVAFSYVSIQVSAPRVIA